MRKSRRNGNQPPKLLIIKVLRETPSRVVQRRPISDDLRNSSEGSDFLDCSDYALR